MTLQIVPGDPLGAPALGLLAEAVVEARARYPEFFDPAAPAPTNAPLIPRSAFLLANLDGEVVGCGALRPLDDATAEIKRMFVTARARRLGVARALLQSLVACAREFDFRMVLLKTGHRQPEAIALYDSAGFRRIAPFGPYVGDPTSVCFELDLAR